MAYPQRTGKSQRRGEITRQHLIRETKRLLAGTDFHSVTLDQVAEAAGIAKSSILWHFGSKEALLTEAVFDLFEEVDEKITLEKSSLPTLAGRLAYMLETVGEYFESNPEAKGIVVTLLFNNSTPGEIRDRVREHWDQHLEEIREFLSGSDARITRAAASAIMATMHGVYIQWYLQGCEPGIKQQLIDAFDAVTALQGPVSESAKRESE